MHIVHICLLYCSAEDETIGEITTICAVQYMQYAYFNVHIVYIVQIVHIAYLVHIASGIALLKMKQLVRLQLSAAASQEMGEGNTAMPPQLEYL